MQGCTELKTEFDLCNSIMIQKNEVWKAAILKYLQISHKQLDSDTAILGVRSIKAPYIIDKALWDNITLISTV